MNFWSTDWRQADLMFGWRHGAEPLRYRSILRSVDDDFPQDEWGLEIAGQVNVTNEFATDAAQFRKPVTRFSEEFSDWFGASMPTAIRIADINLDIAAALDMNGYWRMRISEEDIQQVLDRNAPAIRPSSNPGINEWWQRWIRDNRPSDQADTVERQTLNSVYQYATNAYNSYNAFNTTVTDAVRQWNVAYDATSSSWNVANYEVSAADTSSDYTGDYTTTISPQPRRWWSLNDS